MPYSGEIIVDICGAWENAKNTHNTDLISSVLVVVVGETTTVPDDGVKSWRNWS